VANLFLTRGADNKVYAYAGFSGTLVGTINATATPAGVSIEDVGPDGQLHLVVGNSTSFFRHDAGFSSTIVDTFPHFTGIFNRDLGKDASGNLQVASGLFNIFAKYAGVSATLLASFVGATSGGFISEAPSGDNYASSTPGGVPTFVRFAGFSPTIVSSFALVGDIFITGGQALSNGDMMAVRYWSLFGGVQVVSWFAGFTSTLVAQIASPIAAPGGLAYHEGTYDFNVRVNATASPLVTVSTIKPLNGQLVKLATASPVVVVGCVADGTRFPPAVVGIVEAVARLSSKVGARAAFEPRVSAGARPVPRVEVDVRFERKVDADARLALKVEAEARLGPKR